MEKFEELNVPDFAKELVELTDTERQDKFCDSASACFNCEDCIFHTPNLDKFLKWEKNYEFNKRRWG